MIVQGTFSTQVFPISMQLTTPLIRSCCFTMMALASACSSHVPPEIRQHLDGSPNIAQVREAVDSHISKKVRWGGIILSIENKQKESWLTILATPLNDFGKPQTSDKSQGRFIAIVEQFLEPLLYSKDRKITVTGKLLGTETVKIGEYPYQHPIVQVDQHYLWPTDPEPSELDRYPYWLSDPWYDPYYPWHSPYYPYRYKH